MGEDCVFCRIIQGEEPANVPYEDEKVMAFMDVFPVNQGHVLVVPKEHAPFLADLDPKTGGEVFKAAMRVAKALRGTDIRCDGINLILADGEVAGQEVFHVHLHVIPRYTGDNFSMSSRTRDRPQREELETMAQKISALLE